MLNDVERRKAAIWSAFRHGEMDEEEATRELLAAERAARLAEPAQDSSWEDEAQARRDGRG